MKKKLITRLRWNKTSQKPILRDIESYRAQEPAQPSAAPKAMEKYRREMKRT